MDFGPVRGFRAFSSSTVFNEALSWAQVAVFECIALSWVWKKVCGGLVYPDIALSNYRVPLTTITMISVGSYYKAFYRSFRSLHKSLVWWLKVDG